MYGTIIPNNYIKQKQIIDSLPIINIYTFRVIVYFSLKKNNFFFPDEMWNAPNETLAYL